MVTYSTLQDCIQKLTTVDPPYPQPPYGWSCEGDIRSTVDSQPKVNGLKVKTLGPMDVKIIRSKPSILGSKIGRNLRIMVQIGRNLVGIL